MAVINTPEAAAQLLRLYGETEEHIARLDPNKAVIRRVTNRWFTSRALETVGVTFAEVTPDQLAGEWNEVETVIALQRFRDREYSGEVLASGIYVTDRTADEFRYVRRIKEVIPSFINTGSDDFAGYLGLYEDDANLTTGAEVMLAAVVDMARPSMHDRGLLGREVYRDYKDAKMDKPLIRVQHVKRGLATWIDTRTDIDLRR